MFVFHFSLVFFHSVTVVVSQEPKQPKTLVQLVNGLLYPRDPGSPGSEVAQFFIAEHFTQLEWGIEFDPFERETVIGKVHFSNIIARFRPECARQIILACHYDSRKKPAGFLGATDSAVPCAINMDIAQYLSKPGLLQLPKGRSCIGVTEVFFDGEEAFVAFDGNDGLYGSTHLAAKWDNSTFSGNFSELDRICLFVLLDLIGAASPKFYSYYNNHDLLPYAGDRNKYYDVAMKLEQDLEALFPSNLTTMFTGIHSNWPIVDDQKPFVARGVDQVLHLIPSPFPSVWHTLNDNFEALDFEYIDRLSLIMKLFTVQMLETL